MSLHTSHHQDSGQLHYATSNRRVQANSWEYADTQLVLACLNRLIHTCLLLNPLSKAVKLSHSQKAIYEKQLDFVVYDMHKNGRKFTRKQIHDRIKSLRQLGFDQSGLCIDRPCSDIQDLTTHTLASEIQLIPSLFDSEPIIVTEQLSATRIGSQSSPPIEPRTQDAHKKTQNSWPISQVRVAASMKSGRGKATRVSLVQRKKAKMTETTNNEDEIHGVSEPHTAMEHEKHKRHKHIEPATTPAGTTRFVIEPAAKHLPGPEQHIDSKCLAAPNIHQHTLASVYLQKTFALTAIKIKYQRQKMRCCVSQKIRTHGPCV